MPDFDLSPDPRLDSPRLDTGAGAGAGRAAAPDLAIPDLATTVGSSFPAAGPAAGAEPVLPPGRPRVSAHPPPVGLALLQILACCGYPTQILTMLLMSVVGFRHVSNTNDWSLTYVGALLLIDSVILIGLIVTFLRLHGERPTDVFLGIHPVPGEIVRGLLLLPVVFAIVGTVAFFVQRYAPWLHDKDVNPFQSLIREPHGVLVVSALSVIVGGLREEIQRAFVLHRFTQIGTPIVGLLLFSVLFGLGHTIQGWDAVVMTTMLGLSWGVVYLRRRSLVAPAVCHGIFDVIQVAALGFLT